MSGYVGKAIVRVDGRDKVRGLATYTADWALPGLCHAVLVTSPSAGGKLAAIDTRAAEASPGVLAVLTHKNARPWGLGTLTNAIGRKAAGAFVPPDGSLALVDDVIRHAGQPVAMVVAETPEQARHAAALVTCSYARAPMTVDFEGHLDQRIKPDSMMGEPPDGARGDVEAALAAAPVKLELTYRTAAQSHSPMEPHATVAEWSDGKLLLYDATQYVHGVKMLMAVQFGMLPGKIRVVSRFVGGAFGSKGLPWPNVPLAALAARHVGRPVKLVVDRRDMYGLTGFRPATHQQLRLGADKDGKLLAIAHDGTSQVSREGSFTEPVAKSTRFLYSCANVAVTHRQVRLDTQSPTFQRAPGEAPGSLALECALDELAHALGLDPLALRLKNFADHDEDRRLPYSSKALKACYRQGAERFGWAPGARREGHLLVGQGMATATYPAMRSGATAKVLLNADGRALVRIGTHDLGTGTYTILTQVAADALGLALEQVKTEIGDTDYPYAPVAGGSQSAASCCVPVQAAAREVLAQLVKLAVNDPASPLHGLGPNAVEARDGLLRAVGDERRHESHQQVLARAGKGKLEAQHETKPGDEDERFSAHAWGAQFAEVQVDPQLGTVRVTRMVGAFAGGTILNLTTARSQLLGGMVMGIGAALLEGVERDPHQGRVVNGSLEGYMLPVHADVPAIDVILVPEADSLVNPMGIKGLGELGIVGAGAAIANAVFNATGKRFRDFPLTTDKLLAAF